jgi:hypothetical protein
MGGGRADAEGPKGDAATAKEEDWQPAQSVSQNSANGGVREPNSGDCESAIVDSRDVPIERETRSADFALATTASARGSNAIESMKRRRSR